MASVPQPHNSSSSLPTNFPSTNIPSNEPDPVNATLAWQKTSSPTSSPKQTKTTTKGNTPAKTKEKKSSRAGVPNYSEEDLNALLDIAEDVEPLGANHRSIVANRFMEWATVYDRQKRDFESLRNKFDKLANAKKKAGDPSCPTPVRRAKHIARAIQNKCGAMTLDSSGEEDDGDNSERGGVDEGTTEDAEKDVEVVGARKKKRKTAATGIAKSPKPKTEEALLEHVETVAGHIVNLSKSIAGTFGLSGTQKEDLVVMIRDEVREIMRLTYILAEKVGKFLDCFSEQKP